ncbi:MAG: hypothetical protein KGI97_01045 [Alphaproteobacteria bacterium]|nr:hypothetical protein [Alphaproteobacteria bacterium]
MAVFHKYLRRAAAAAAFCALFAPDARADYYKVYAPQVDQGEISLEANVNYSADHRKALDHYLSQVYGVEYGVTRHWSTELSAEIEKSSGTAMRLTMLKWENVFVPFRPGAYWLDAGFYVELEKSMLGDMPDNAEGRILLQKKFGAFTHTANISFNNNFGAHALPGVDTGFSWQTKYHVSDKLEPGFEYYSDLGRLNRDYEFNRQDSSIGPVLEGHIGDMTYDTGVLLGVSNTAHDVTVKFNLEYGF